MSAHPPGRAMSRALAAIRNPHAVVRLLRAARPARWPARLAAPVDPLDTHQRMRATSLLAGMEFRDGSRHPDTLTLSQAHDVLRWATARIL